MGSIAVHVLAVPASPAARDDTGLLKGEASGFMTKKETGVKEVEGVKTLP